MIEQYMSQWSAFVNEVSGGNEMLAAGISLWAVGVATYLARGVPARIWSTLNKYLTTSMTMNNAGYEQEGYMFYFIKWVQPRMKSSMSRTLSLTTTPMYNDGEDVTLGLGYGTHFFFYNRRLFWLSKSRLDSSGSQKQKDEVSITTIGRSHQPFFDMLKDFVPVRDKKESIDLYRLDKEGDWVSYSYPPKRSLDGMAISEELKNNLREQIQHFKDNREWFYFRGLAYKLTYLLYGMPGTGKTSIIKALASEFNMNICIININKISDSILEACISDIPKNSMVIIEDFDSSIATSDRSMGFTASVVDPLTITGFLNALDGVNPLDDCILFLTTNHLEKIDPAIYRKGRVDHLLEIGEISGEDVKKYSQTIFPDYDFSDTLFNSCIGCKLNEALLYAKEDPEKYLENLREGGVV